MPSGWQSRTALRMTIMHHGLSRSEEHTSELQSPDHLVCLLLLEKKHTAGIAWTRTRAGEERAHVYVRIACSPPLHGDPQRAPETHLHRRRPNHSRCRYGTINDGR